MSSPRRNAEDPLLGERVPVLIDSEIDVGNRIFF
jgi:hypothetical protein